MKDHLNNPKNLAKLISFYKLAIYLLLPGISFQTHQPYILTWQNAESDGTSDMCHTTCTPHEKIDGSGAARGRVHACSPKCFL